LGQKSTRGGRKENDDKPTSDIPAFFYLMFLLRFFGVSSEGSSKTPKTQQPKTFHKNIEGEIKKNPM
jgi:hypothetical protein